MKKHYRTGLWVLVLLLLAGLLLILVNDRVRHRVAGFFGVDATRQAEVMQQEPSPSAVGKNETAGRAPTAPETSTSDTAKPAETQTPDEATIPAGTAKPADPTDRADNGSDAKAAETVANLVLLAKQVVDAERDVFRRIDEFAVRGTGLASRTAVGAREVGDDTLKAESERLRAIAAELRATRDDASVIFSNNRKQFNDLLAISRQPQIGAQDSVRAFAHARTLETNALNMKQLHEKAEARLAVLIKGAEAFVANVDAVKARLQQSTANAIGAAKSEQAGFAKALQSLSDYAKEGVAAARAHVANAEAFEDADLATAMRETMNLASAFSVRTNQLQDQHRDAGNRIRSLERETKTAIPNVAFAQRAESLLSDVKQLRTRISAADVDGRQLMEQINAVARPVEAKLEALAQTARARTSRWHEAVRDFAKDARADRLQLEKAFDDAHGVVRHLYARAQAVPGVDIRRQLGQAENHRRDMRNLVQRAQALSRTIMAGEKTIASILSKDVLTPQGMRQAQAVYEQAERNAPRVKQLHPLMTYSQARLRRVSEEAEARFLEYENNAGKALRSLVARAGGLDEEAHESFARLTDLEALSGDLLNKAEPLRASTDDTRSAYDQIAQARQVITAQRAQGRTQLDDIQSRFSALKALGGKSAPTQDDLRNVRAGHDFIARTYALMAETVATAEQALDQAQQSLQTLQDIARRREEEAAAAAAAEAAKAAETAKAADAVKPPVSMPAPTFDIVRLLPTGEAVLAGRAAPGAEVTLYANGQVAGTATANRDGDWAMTLARQLDLGVSELTLRARDPLSGQTTVSEQSVTVQLPSHAVDEALIVLNVPGSPSTILRAPAETTAPLQEKATIAISLVDIEDDGTLHVQGRGLVGARIRLYLDNRFLGETNVDGNGDWTLSLSRALVPGEHTLRADQIDADGRVIARAEAVTTRPRTVIAAAPDTADDEGRADAVDAGPKAAVEPAPIRRTVVRRGDSLWRISRKTYGRGARYVMIYRANRDQIRDPDLIYPGQVFTLPRQ